MRLLDLAPRSDLTALAAAFARDRRIQIPDILTRDSAATVQRILARETPWGLAWQAGADGPHYLRQQAIPGATPDQHQSRHRAVQAALRGTGYAFEYSSYPMVQAYQERWAPDGPHDMLLEYLNDRPVLDLVRAVTGAADIVKADAQATLYLPGQFLAMHDDREDAGGRRIAYVLSLCGPGWRPDWGGYLQFYDAGGDVIAGYRPRFNVLNLFAVPQAHNVTPVSIHAPPGRFAITGWFRDR